LRREREREREDSKLQKAMNNDYININILIKKGQNNNELLELLFYPADIYV
jgi:hypothetical protein